MPDLESLESPTSKFPFSEEELLKDLNTYNSHADELTDITEIEFGNSLFHRASTPFNEK